MLKGEVANRLLESHIYINGMLHLGLNDEQAYGALALTALTETPTELLSVWTAVRVHKDLVKVGGGAATAFTAKAKEVFPHSTYFKAL